MLARFQFSTPELNSPFSFLSPLSLRPSYFPVNTRVKVLTEPIKSITTTRFFFWDIYLFIERQLVVISEFDSELCQIIYWSIFGAESSVSQQLISNKLLILPHYRQDREGGGKGEQGCHYEGLGLKGF